MAQIMMSKFQAGETVALRSGGPALTVLGVMTERVHCVFFSEEIGEFRETVLPAMSLTHVEISEEDEDEDSDEDNGNDDAEDDETPETDASDEDVSSTAEEHDMADDGIAKKLEPQV